MLRQARESSESTPFTEIGLRHTASVNASYCIELFEDGSPVEECWRFGILQTLDDYTSTLRRGGVELAAQVFDEEPPPTGSSRIDAAFAALAAYLANRDEWTTPEWANDPTRTTSRWFANVPEIFREDAERETPNAFRSRGIFITSRSLARA